MQNDTLVSVDLAKLVFQLAVSEQPGQVTRRPRLRRDQFLEFFAQLRPATVVMEACSSAHFWGRRIEELGHRVEHPTPGTLPFKLDQFPGSRSDGLATPLDDLSHDVGRYEVHASGLFGEREPERLDALP